MQLADRSDESLLTMAHELRQEQLRRRGSAHTCAACGKEFVVRSARACSTACRARAQRTRTRSTRKERGAIGVGYEGLTAPERSCDNRVMSLLWDQHACVALSAGADVSELSRYRGAGGGFVSLNVGYTPQSHADTDALLRSFHSQIAADGNLLFAETVADIDAAAAAGRTAVAFDLEDSAPLDGDLINVARLAHLGVRTLAPTYNRQNQAGCGCLDATDSGLSSWGRALLAEMNNVGMVPDGSHCSIRTGLDMCALSAAPVIYSHSCMRAVWDHPRNITDDQARACADTGGVVGITGVGIFLGPNTPTLEAMTRHLEYAINLVGVAHVGVSTDYSFDYLDFLDEINRAPELFDSSYTQWGAIQWMSPEIFVGLRAHLRTRGWNVDDIDAVLGGNFRRVAQQTWGARAAA